MDLAAWLHRAVENHRTWEESHGPYPDHPALRVEPDRFAAAFDELGSRLAGSYPFFHPRYAGQMLKPPHPAAVVGHLAAMLVNPNNHALDGGPATSALEVEVMEQLAAMVGFDDHLGHLTSSGTLGNLEALFVARELHPGRGVAYSAESHYTHERMCRLLGVRGHPVAVDAAGRTDLGALEELLRTGAVGTVVATTGTTALGAVDPLHLLLPLARAHGARVHVDAAYGGFHSLLTGVPRVAPGDGSGAGGGDGSGGTASGPLVDPAPWAALGDCDSVVIDPHKHGLQPYGCGAVLFRDRSTARFFRHDSPYTYFTSRQPHLGEISLECSRAGAAAAALWLTLRLFPLTPDGLGAVLAPGRRAALRWAELLADDPDLVLYQPPELDIVCCFPRTAPATAPLTAPRVSAASEAMLAAGMREGEPDPVFLSTTRVTAAAFAARHPEIPLAGARQVTVVRSALMKPESEPWLPQLHDRVAALARGSHEGG
ncbi:pyridoxal phosphate-dependent decarboxylase family protein [Streptomyces lonarensis]|uniref:Aminotransferase class V-fold PLP-dependent enzyme n=1 Tax=Streptomyces lonarensis TaxID=700599 RepID=A0A7X6D332_9ACTN|nr:aminotransferase class I/II-fold pyridoxal phosphate-dependent enzyme [Streptomyces lonarensis]NJQ07297.1 aminotransferase class V-fold PLP-dependent enzyme [Streptomyces lonarensis]